MNMITEPARQLAANSEFDVIVCGGGPAGVAAALGAARSGAKTCLIETHGCLGGIWTSGALCCILDSMTKGGVMREIFERLDEWGARTNKVIADVEAMKLLLERMCLDAGVHIRLHTRVVAAHRSADGKRMAAVVTESKSGREAWQAKVFIDTTGDGDLAMQAGCSFEYGAPQAGATQPMSLIALVTADEPEHYAPWTSDTQARGIRLKEEAVRAGFPLSYQKSSIWHVRDRLYLMMANHEYGSSALNAEHISRATIHARQELNDLVSAMRSLGGVWGSMRLVQTADQIGVREGRRILGRYYVTVKDIISGRTHEDAVCRVRFPLDVHSPHPDESSGMAKLDDQFLEYRRQTKPYDIPLRALIARDTDGLLMAGRCISGDFLAHSSYRVTGNAVPMGEAAGVLAGVACRQGVMPHEVPWNEVKDRLN